MKFMIEVLIYKVIDINQSIKDKKFEGVDERVSKERRLLTRNLNNFMLFKVLKAFSLASK